MSTIHDIWYQTFLIQHDIMLNEMGMIKYSQIKYIYIVDTSNSLFIIKDFHGKFHHSISQRLFNPRNWHNNPRHNILQLYIILFILIEQKINHESWIIWIFNEIFGMLFICNFNMVACQMEEAAFELLGVYHFSLWTQFPCPKSNGVLHGSAGTTLLQQRKYTTLHLT